MEARDVFSARARGGADAVAASYADAANAPLTVTDAVAIASGSISKLPTLTVTGEVTGFRGPQARSGNCFFQVKDEQSCMEVMVWKGVYEKCGFELQDGMLVELKGKFDVYKSKGSLSFKPRSLSLSGEGLLRQRVAELALRLEAEGLMVDRGRRIPPFCERVAVVTSLSGEVIDDVKRTLARRNPFVEVLVSGCQIQGPGAPATIIHALDRAAAAWPDAILLVRGGGSYEDLMTFNDETLARAVRNCPVPVITGIGHEPDVTICDMVADRRCSTPTGAAESVAPALSEMVEKNNERRRRLIRRMQEILGGEDVLVTNLGVRCQNTMDALLVRLNERVELLGSRRCMTDPESMVTDRLDQLAMTEERLHSAIPRSLERNAADLARMGERLSLAGPRVVAREGERLDRTGQALLGAGTRMLRPFELALSTSAGKLDALSPLKVLSRGYSIVTREDGSVVSDAASVSVGDSVSVQLGKGSISAQVTGLNA